MIFESGYKEIDSKAKKLLAATDDDLTVPSWGDQFSAAFDAAYFRAGSGIANTVRDKLVERNSQLAKLMEEQGFPSDAINAIHLNRPDIIPEGMSKDDFARTNPHYKPELYEEVMSMFKDQVKLDDELMAEAKQEAKGIVSSADKVLARGDSLTAAFTGAVGGVFTDPAVIATTFIPLFNSQKLPATMMSVGNILKQSGKVGAASMAGEVFSLPLQSQNAAFLGEKFGVWEAATNLALAGAGGSILSAVGLSGLKATDFVKKTIKGINDAADAPLEALDAALTLGKVSDSIKTPEDIEALIKTQDDTLAGAADWTKDINQKTGQFGSGAVYDDILGVDDIAPEQAAKIDPVQSSIYDEFMTPDDAIRDAQMLKKASQLDVKIQERIDVDETGEQTQVLRSYKEAAAEIQKEIEGIEAVAMCLRGGA